jgi:hypothetical protein
MTNLKIPIEIQEKANQAIADFNLKTFEKNPGIKYFASYRGAFLYLNRIEGNKDGPVARLKFKGSFTNWEFAIYRFTKDNYFPMEYLFPGYDCVDGTIEGAMKAGNKAYPPRWAPADANITNFFKHLFGK